MNRSTGFASVRTFLAAIFLILSPSISHGDGTAITVRSADLKSGPAHHSETIIELSPGQSIEVGERKGAWFRARTSDGISGWIRMLAVRYQTATKESSMLDSLSKASRSKTTVATGVRGLDKEMLAGATPNHARLQELLGFPYTATDARRFAMEGGLKTREVGSP